MELLTRFELVTSSLPKVQKKQLIHFKARNQGIYAIFITGFIMISWKYCDLTAYILKLSKTEINPTLF